MIRIRSLRSNEVIAELSTIYIEENVVRISVDSDEWEDEVIT
jgi:hypothetical protein